VVDFSPFSFCYSATQLFFCYATTQLALQVQQERTQVVCSNEEAWKRLAKALPQWTLDIFVLEVMYLYVGSIFGMWNVVLKRFIHMLVVDWYM